MEPLVDVRQGRPDDPVWTAVDGDGGEAVAEELVDLVHQTRMTIGVAAARGCARLVWNDVTRFMKCKPL